MLLETLGTARDLGRAQEIAAVLVRHGFGDIVRRMGLADALGKAGHVLHLDHAAELARIEPPAQVRRALEELGPTFVKLGQILAGRGDLLGPEWIAELAKLHSRVPAVPLEALRPQLREDLGGEPEDVFARFDAAPLAAASIAQVHRAQLKDGTEVVVKIRRPAIVDVIEADLRLLERVAAGVEQDWPALKPYRPRQLLREFAKSLRRELNLAAECRHAERIATNLAPLGDVVIPRVHWAWTHERVNVQDFIDGVPGEDLERIVREGLDPKLLARRGARAVLKMIVEDGFFHADPHPGNVFYLPGNRLAFIDFGMVGQLSKRRRDELLTLLLGLVERRPQAVADVLIDWSGNHHGADLSQLEDDIEAFVQQYHGTPLAQLSLGQMLADVTAVLREHKLALGCTRVLILITDNDRVSASQGCGDDGRAVDEVGDSLGQTLVAGAARPRPGADIGRQAEWQAVRRSDLDDEAVDRPGFDQVPKMRRPSGKDIARSVGVREEKHASARRQAVRGVDGIFGGLVGLPAAGRSLDDDERALRPERGAH